MTVLLKLLHYFILPLLSRLLFFLPIKALKKRAQFEKKNLKDFRCRSFLQDNKKADFCFEVSSEGEFESAVYLMIQLLKEKKLVELIYCSPSVEHKVISLYEEYPEQMRILRMPLLIHRLSQRAFNPLKWISADHLFLTRYDFFPSLILFGRLRAKRFTLLAATALGKRFSGFNGPWWKYIFSSFDLIFTSDLIDRDLLRTFFSKPKIEQFDYRVLTISERLNHRDEKFSSLKFIPAMRKQFPSREKRLIFGSFWFDEAAMFEEQSFIDKARSRETFILIAPHDLSSENINALEQYFSQKSLKVLITDGKDADIDADIIILTAKGVLCELYYEFGHAFIGGGYRKSVHSVLEPYLANCRVFLGPKVHRSTEHRLISQLSKNEVHIVERPQDFYTIFEEKQFEDIDRSIRHDLITDHQQRAKSTQMEFNK